VLDVDYSTRLGELIHATDWNIELPVEWKGFFEERGEIPSYKNDERHNLRLKVRTHGILWFERHLPFQLREREPVGIYTRDFSRYGAGFLCPFQIFPEERVRIILPTFWVRLHVARARRITSKCYEIGAMLIQRCDPSELAFDIDRIPDEASAV